MMKKLQKQKESIENKTNNFLINKKVIRHNMKRIQGKLLKVRTYDVHKISLSCFNDKRYVLNDGGNTLAYFHKDMKD